jgi:hypothetical protein
MYSRFQNIDNNAIRKAATIPFHSDQDSGGRVMELCRDSMEDAWDIIRPRTPIASRRKEAWGAPTTIYA